MVLGLYMLFSNCRSLGGDWEEDVEDGGFGFSAGRLSLSFLEGMFRLEKSFQCDPQGNISPRPSSHPSEGWAPPHSSPG